MTRIQRRLFLLCMIGCWLSVQPLQGATLTNNASISISDPTSSLTATGTTFTVSCWFRIVVPSSLSIADNMTIVMDRTDGNESANYSYLLRYNYISNVVEFVTHGSSATYSQPLITAPFLNRWYHVAVSRSGSTFNCYVDGRALQPGNASIGTATGSGVAIGGINGTSKQFYGDIVEVAMYSTALSLSSIQNGMFKDQRNFPNIKGYYKLGASTNASDNYHNFVPTPPSGTDPAMHVGAGTITFNAVDEAGEQSLFDANLNHGEDAATPLSGAFAWTQTAFSRPTPGIAFSLEYGYSSALPTLGQTLGQQDPYDVRVLGPKWRNTFDMRVVLGATANEVDLVKWDGSIDEWTRTNTFAPFATKHHEYHGELQQLSPSAEIQWTTPGRLNYLFRDPTDTADPMAGRLEQIQDLNGNTVTLQWDENAFVVTNVLDTAGGNYRFSYDPARQFLLTNVSFGAWQINFGYDATNRLSSKSLTNTSGLYSSVNTTWQFRYGTNGLLSQIIDPRNNTNLVIQYDQYGRQTNEVDALGRATRTEYDVPSTWQIRQTDAGSNQWVQTFDTKGHLLAQQDPLLNTTTYTYDSNGNRTSITEPLSWTTYFGYDTNANMVAKTNALNEVTTWVFDDDLNKPLQQITPQPLDVNGSPRWTNFYLYDATGNLTNQSDGLGTIVSYTYFSNGLVHTSSDANGNVTSFTYDTNWFLKTQTDAATNTTTFSRNDVGWKMREVNALTEPTTYSYNFNGNITKKEDALARIFYNTYDANGNLLTNTDGKTQITSYGYDVANQRTNMVDRTRTNVWLYFYTSRGKLDHVTDPLNHAITNYYDAANRLARISDPLGNTVTNQYDANGNLQFFFDKLGRRWVKTYDRLNRLQTESDPLGNTKQTTFDVAGRVQQVSSPNGYPSFNNYDGRGRLIKWTDPQNFPWIYNYDGVGNITNITDANQGHYIMVYSNRNERILERNQDQFEWRYTYDPLVRLKTETDPNQITKTIGYDSGGRIQSVDFTTGRHDGFTYDDNDNMKTLVRRTASDSSSVQLFYDALDRVKEQDDANAQTVLYGYDPLGRTISITYPGNRTLQNFYDALGRMTNQLDWASRSTSYTYDIADRLLTRKYPNGVVQSNSFDTAGRLMGLSYSSPNPSTNSIQVALSYAYDHNGNKTGGGEKGTFSWPLPSLTDDNTQFSPAGRMETRQIQNNSALSNQLSTVNYQYDASGNMTNAVQVRNGANVQSWTLSYDEDNRTTSIAWTNSTLSDSMIINRYDALGRRFAKTVDGVTSGYVLSLSGGMDRVLCDLDRNNNVTAWYVHGPDICYRVDETNGLTFFHADALGNIIALTDAAANTISEYAYTPYGRSLGDTNCANQMLNPYLFAGSQGVVEELPGLYFMRARYYSAYCAVFFSTDSVKKIGPSWRPIAYSYAGCSPLGSVDPCGTEPVSDAIMFGVGLVGDFGLQLYKYHQDPNYVPSVAELWMSGATAAVATEVAEQAVPFAVSAGASEALAATFRIASSALVNGAGNVIGQKVTKGRVNFDEAATSVFFSGAGDYLSEFVPDFPINTENYPSAVKSYLLNTVSKGAVSTGIENTLDGALFTLQNRAATVAAPQAIASNVSTSTKPQASTGAASTNGGGGNSSYVVKPGDTLGNIAWAAGTTATALGSANGIANLNLIHPGQVLTIPKK